MSRAHSYSHSRAHTPTFPSLHLRHNSFSNSSVALPTSQLILQPFRCFTYVTAHSPTLLSFHLRHRLFTYVTWRADHAWSNYITAHSPTLLSLHLRHRLFTYVTAHSDSPNFPSLHLRHSSFSNPCMASSTSQLIFRPFLRFTYVTTHSTTFPLFHLRHRHFTYVLWRAAHAK